ncbi:zinc-binding dehydrogenase [Streptomyces sp. ICBB 8177]|uniref:quinone oxidoreductase family protein n=1 Tax=Streptomyces sp. ICBB 8177 TaxID=563922 RepID=UPI000D67D09D|nr:zinc-binding dehydrogenase [Streptomyces sp. ICBB 8177]PWI42523.1 oxidoreductase [Streptomyces sp. ICBB 8177]
MRIVRYHQFGTPEVFQVDEIDKPEPGPGQVRVRAEAIGVNFAGIQERAGEFYYEDARPLPGCPGGDAVGFIDALGPGVTGFEVGERVASIIFQDAFAEYSLARAKDLVRVPAELDAAEATMLSSPAQVGLEVIQASFLKEGETVLVHAAAGAIGHLAVQMARALGARQVVATAKGERKLAFARELGADVAVDYSLEGWEDEIREATGGGVDVVLDSVGADVTHKSLALLKPFGRLVFYGSAGGGLDLPKVSLEDLAGKYLTHFSMGVMDRTVDNYDGIAAQVCSLLLGGSVRPVVHARLPLEEAAEAHRIMEARAQLGRIVLIP